MPPLIHPATRFSLTLLLLSLLPNVASAATFYIDPATGSTSNDGSQSSPWRTLQEVIEHGLIESQRWNRPYKPGGGKVAHNAGAPVKGGDTLILMSGYHGKIDIHWYQNSRTITVRAGNNQTPTASQLHFQSSARWTVSGLTISPEFGETDESNLIRVESHSYNGPSSHITITNNTLYSAKQIRNWSVNDWLSRAKSGISVDGEHSVIRHNTISNIGFGITVSADHVTVQHNSVINFSGDALRGLGNYGVFEYNFVANAFKVNSNHDDGFQSWSRDGKPVVGVVLRGNQFHTNSDHPNPALLSTFQGIGCFDGYYNNWIIENNLLAVSHWHGISLYGANNSRIVNNTVVDSPAHDNDRMVPWIRLTTHKNGTHGRGNVVRNNIGRLASISTGVSLDHNLDPLISPSDHSNYQTIFRSPDSGNYQLTASSPAIGAGSTLLAPAIDITGKPRSGAIDLGAFQHRSAPLTPLMLLLEDEPKTSKQ
ncbi:hypothetical protein GCM10008090_06350 [Arenicella chitinivorans]|uniref:Right handed beta helix domain-containing protein n=1 Tax=Arenicella chitinivorans TaxID=1329800 RepID=A0A918VGV4_9GAMM|nr:right-handed parallel beta-helix repeat-containing protein [Arenicella chitinivorans]GHA00347.1 hypothetical protein GCM10008090_06350 [Arenicella chitinivorans]